MKRTNETKGKHEIYGIQNVRIGFKNNFVSLQNSIAFSFKRQVK